MSFQTEFDEGMRGVRQSIEAAKAAANDIVAFRSGCGEHERRLRQTLSVALYDSADEREWKITAAAIKHAINTMRDGQ